MHHAKMPVGHLVRFFNSLQRFVIPHCDITNFNSPTQVKRSRSLDIRLLCAGSLLCTTVFKKREIRVHVLKKFVHRREQCKIILTFHVNAKLLNVFEKLRGENKV